MLFFLHLFDLKINLQSFFYQSRKYANILTDQRIESTCSRLIELVAEEERKISSTNQDENINEEEQRKRDIYLEGMIIDEFGKCLSELIELAENEKT